LGCEICGILLTIPIEKQRRAQITIFDHSVVLERNTAPSDPEGKSNSR